MSVGMGKAEIAAAVKDSDSTYRVYRREWTIDARFALNVQAAAYSKELVGRVREADYRTVVDGLDETIRVEVRRWNVVAEVKDPDDAMRIRQALVARDGWSDIDVAVVMRNSKAEHTLIAADQPMQER